MRTKLKVLRVSNNLTQGKMAELLGYSLASYNQIEQGKRVGSVKFWSRLQNEFELEDDAIWQMQKQA